MRQIGLYGGSFDPVHLGHLNLAVEVADRHALDEVWFIPCRLSPHKNEQPTAGEHRLEMLRLATAGWEKARVLDIELKREGPSFTVDTVKSLIADHPDLSFSLIIGADNLPGLPRWHAIEELVTLVPLLVGERSGGGALPADAPLALREAVEAGKVPTTLFDISATELRARLAKKKWCNHLISHKVLDYIEINRLYC